jgi:hypothetical protein
MPVISYPYITIAIAGSTGNILAGKTFEFVNRAVFRLGIATDDATNKVLLTIINGTTVETQDDPIMLGTAGIIKDPDDFHYEWVGRGRQQILIRNTNAAAKFWWAVLKIQPV